MDILSFLRLIQLEMIVIEEVILQDNLITFRQGTMYLLLGFCGKPIHKLLQHSFMSLRSNP